MIEDEGAQRDADRRMVALMARGEAVALGELYDRHARAIYSLALRIVTAPADAEEIVQDVFTQAWRQSARYDPSRSSVVGWLLMMTRTRAIDRLRARHSRPDVAANDDNLQDIPGATGSPESLVIGRQTLRTLRDAVGTLPQIFRAPIELAYYEGLSHSAIAERLGEPLGTVKTRMRSALTKLRSALNPEGRP